MGIYSHCVEEIKYLTKVFNMQRGNWCNILAEAYCYSSKYLIFCLSVIVASVIFIWIYERPQLYKLIFKKSKQSTVFSPSTSDEILIGNGNKICQEIENQEINHDDQLGDTSRSDNVHCIKQNSHQNVKHEQ